LKVLLIGAGRFGKNHARILADKNILAAVYDIDFNTASKIGQQYGVKYHTSMNPTEFAPFDAAVVCTPSKTHVEIIRECLSMGLHVFVEKPISHDFEEVRTLVKIADHLGLVLAVGMIERFTPGINEFRNKYKRLEFIRGSITPKHIDTTIVWDTAIHDIDLACYLSGSKPAYLEAEVTPDEVRLEILFKNETTAGIHTKWGAERIRWLNADGKRFDLSMVKYDKLETELQNFVDACEGRARFLVDPKEMIKLTSFLQVISEKMVT